MDPLLAGVLAIVGVIGLLVARGMWLLGRESNVETIARVATADSSVASTGWTMLDKLQTANLPFVAYLERRLGINQADREGCGD